MKSFEDIPKLDSNHIFDAVDAQPDHLKLQFADEMRHDVTPAWAKGINNIVLAGMGGSALASDILRNWLGDKLTLPFETIRTYDLPGYVNENSLVIISSYSGNTEEAVNALKDAQNRKAHIMLMVAGGELLDLAEDSDYLVLRLPKVSQPRLSVFAGVKALACLLGDMGLIGDSDLRRELEDVGDWLHVEKSRFNLDNQDDDNLAMQIAQKLIGKPVLIYGGFGLRSAAYKWKIDINENSKQLAFCNVWPELNHNEMQGWLFPKEKPLAIIQLSSSFEHERIARRIEVTNDIIAEHGYDPIKIEAEGKSQIAQLLWIILLGDYVSAYLGILNGIDPTPVDLVESFKQKLG